MIYVKEIIDMLYTNLGNDVFMLRFTVILTDNGSEFKDPEIIEYDSIGVNSTKVFYCDPLASYQKPNIERIINI